MQIRFSGLRGFHRVKDRRRNKVHFPSWLISIVGIFAAWESVSLLGIISSDQLPALHDVLIALVQLSSTPAFVERVSQSFFNITAGILLALAFVLPLGLLVGMRSQLDQAITPVIMLVGALPDLAILTLLVKVIGVGNVAAISISAFSAFFPVYFTIRQGVKEIPVDYYHVVSVFKAGKVQSFAKVVFPSIFPNLLTGLRLSFEFSWNVILAVEIIASVAGVGNFISTSLGASRSLTYGLAAVMAVGLLTITIDRAFFERFENQIKRWR